MDYPLTFATFRSWLHEKGPANLLADLQTLNSQQLGLSRVARGSGLFDDDSLSFSLLQSEVTETLCNYRVGIFFREIDTTCPCSGDEQSYLEGYCEMILHIDQQQQAATLTLIDD
jgi:hypothetical protein